MDHVVFGDVLKRHSGLLPSGESAADDAGVETLGAENMRHTDAGGVVQSSAVKIDRSGLREQEQGFGKAVGLEPGAALDALGAGVVIAMAANVNHSVKCRLDS